MNKKYRRALLFVAILIFIAVTPVVILYALGYRTSLTASDPIPVGVLLLETEPTRAKVYVDDKYIGDTPRSIARPAGPVSVRLEKEGYTEWRKVLTLQPGRATEVRDVRLFPTAVQPSVMATGVRSFSLSPNRRLLAVVHQDNTLTILDHTGDVVVPTQPFAATIESHVWSPNSDSLLLTTTGRSPYWHLPISQRARPIPLPGLLAPKTAPLTWDPRIPGRLLYLDAANALRAHTISSAADVALVPAVARFASSASHIYVVHEAGKTLIEYSLQGQPTGTTFPLPEGRVRELLITPQESIAVLMEAGDGWLLHNGREFKRIASGMQTIAWSPSGKVLLLSDTTASLYVYNVNDKRTTLPLDELRLIQRLSRPITSPLWFAGNRHIMYHVDDAIWITETDTRDYPVSYKVDTTNTGSAQTTVGEEGEVIFYLKKKATDTTLVSASLMVQ